MGRFSPNVAHVIRQVGVGDDSAPRYRRDSQAVDVVVDIIRRALPDNDECVARYVVTALARAGYRVYKLPVGQERKDPEDHLKRGRKPLHEADPARYQLVVDMLKAGSTTWAVHKTTGTGHATVVNIKSSLEKENT